MADDLTRVLGDINRTLKDIAYNQKEQLRLLKALNHNYLQVNRRPQDVIEPQPSEPSEPAEPVHIPKVYGWSMAALVQRDGALVKGDIKVDDDESRWVWTGDTWERVEEPSARAPG